MSKRKVLNFTEKIKVIELSKWKSSCQIADELGVGKTQINNILKRKAEILCEVEKNVSEERKRTRRNTGTKM